MFYYKIKFMSIDISQKLYSTFRALRHRNYRLYFTGQCISLIGTWIQQIAMSWLIYTLTKSPLLMGLITFASSVPSLLISPFAGVLIDRINKYNVLILLQTLFLLESAALAILTLTGVIQIWHIVILGVLTGITFAFDMPLRQAFVVELVNGAEDLGNAISLNSSSFNLARLIGPAIAGVLIAAVGEGVCFLINALSYIAVIGALLAMKINIIMPIKKEKMNVIKEFSEGVKYVSTSIQMRNILLYLAMASFIGMSYPVIMPVFIKEILHKGAETLGLLMSASGIGALFGALYLAGRKSVKGLEDWVFYSSLLFGSSLALMAYSTNIWASMALLFVTGFGMVVIIAACNTLLQHFVENNKRGRVMSLYTMAFMGTAPVGSLFGGAIADKIGVPNTFLVTGITMLIAAAFFNTKRKYFFSKKTNAKLIPEETSVAIN